MASVVTAASAFAAVAVPPAVEPPVAQHKGALKTKQNRLVKNIILGFRVPIPGNSDSKQYLEAKLTWLFAREPRQTIYQMKLRTSNNLVLTSPFRYSVHYIR